MTVSFQSTNKRLCTTRTLLLLLLFRVHTLSALAAVRRRHVLTSCGGLGLWPPATRATRGAAELDFEYYVRDGLQGNQREGSVSASPPPARPSPRKITGPAMVFGPSQSDSLALTVLQSQTKSKQADTFVEQARRIHDRVETSFATVLPVANELLLDQYATDLWAYCDYKLLADILPASADRDAYGRALGRAIWDCYCQQQRGQVKQPASLSTLEPVLTGLLEWFVTIGWIDGYRLGDDRSTRTEGKTSPLFDVLDDEALVAGATVDLVFSVRDSVTLQSSLQITAEESRFIPDWIGTTVAAALCPCRVATIESYFVDAVYRPNPKDYFPDEQLYQLGLVAL